MRGHGARPGEVRFALDSPGEQSGFEPLVPLTLNATNTGERDENNDHSAAPDRQANRERSISSTRFSLTLRSSRTYKSP
jgi:hypothetical protein